MFEDEKSSCCAKMYYISYTSPTISFLSQGNNTILLIVMEYPSRSNLNCLIVVLRGLGSGCCFPIPF